MHVCVKVSKVAEEQKKMEELQITLPKGVNEKDEDENDTIASTINHDNPDTENLNKTRSSDESEALSDAYFKNMQPLQYVEVEVLHGYKFSTELASANLRVFSKARIKRLVCK